MNNKTDAVTGEGNAPRVRHITKYYDKLRNAEAYHTRLVNKYDSVTLVGFPRFSDCGNYTWRVTED